MTAASRGLRSSSVRRQNLATLLRLLHLDAPMSRSDIGRRTGLTRTAVANLVGDLTEMGLAVELEPDPTGTRGRPSPVVHPLADSNVVIGIDLMVDSIGVAVIGLGGATLRSMRRDRRRRHQSPESSVADAAAMAQRILDDLRPDLRCFGIGVAIPGMVAQPSQRVVLAPNLGWVDIDILDLLQQAFPQQSLVTVGNEANLAALAESRRGDPAHDQNILFVSGEVGVGGGVIADGRLLTGSNGLAGEIGHTPLNPDGSVCGCGAVGCFETELGEAALLARAGIEGTGRRAVNELIEQAEAGDAEVIASLQEHARWLALGLHGPLNLLDIDSVVIGGLLGRIYPFIAETLTVELADRALLTTRAVPVAPASMGEDATLVGAAEVTWDIVLDDIVSHAARVAASTG